MCCPAQGLRDFSLDYVLDEASGQHEAYNAVAAEQEAGDRKRRDRTLDWTVGVTLVCGSDNLPSHAA
eukprot:1454408-Rhodomonas_salina.1